MNFVGAPVHAASVVGPVPAPVADSLRHVPIEAGRVWAWEAPALGDRIEVIAGRVWVTQAGDPRDVVLAPGQAWAVRERGKTVVQALTAARVRIVTSDRKTRARRMRGPFRSRAR